MLTLPNYQITEQIYESVNSIVYRGLRNNQPVILKMLKQDYPTPAELTRYQQEYEITHNLNLTGVIKIYGIEKYQNTLVIILEDFGGQSLKQFLKNRQFTVKEFLPFATQIADILGNIHASNIIHKDINPSNIIINPKTKQLKIVDFGIASRLPRENPTLKNPEQLEGTLPYISPEQTGRINRSIDYRTDLYSLGVTFYEMLTGKLPFTNTDAMELVHCHIAKVPLTLTEVKPDIPQIISAIVAKLLTKNAEDRYQSAFGLKLDFEKLQIFDQLDGIKFKLAQHNFSGRFQIPQKLYGREEEVKVLLQAFERVSNGNTEMMLVAGYSGVGKSALVHEVHKPMTEKRGYFAEGKFDQFQKNIPYSAITQAFNKFCRYLLLDNNLAKWQEKILAAVGNNGQIILDVIPDLELIIGQQPVVAEVGPTETQNRFQLFFLNFVKALCSKEHPFILFIDDLQWVDSASLGLLKSIMLDDEIQHLLIIGAYRDNEVDKNHPFIMAVNNLPTTKVNTIKLKNLQLSNVNHLLQDTLQCEAGQKLAGLIYQKTQGNAFFVRQFLQSLYTNEFLYFKQYQWHWDIEQIKNQNITANVVALMIEQLKKLPKTTQQVLRLAACIGNQFDLITLAIIYEQPQLTTMQDLSPAIQTGLILPTSELELIDGQLIVLHYKFLHDRVQQAAYALIDDEQKKAVHLKIGQLLLANSSKENIFDIANQFNKGVDLIHTDKLTLAKINLQASQKARQSMASQPALAYVKQAIALLPDENPWQYQLTLQIYQERAEVEFVNSHYDLAEQFINEVIEHTENIVSKVDMYYLLITMYGVKGEFNQAIDTGRKALSLFGIILPNEAEKGPASMEEMEQARNNLHGIEPNSILHWQDLDDANSIMIIKLLVALEPPVYVIGDLSTYVYIVARAVNISVQQRGLVAEISKIYANYGFLIGDIYGDYASSYEFGATAIKIAERYNSGTYICKSSTLFGNWINPWCRPLNQAAAIHVRGYQAGIDAGEYEFAGYNLYGYFNNLFTQGKNLAEVKNEIELYLPLIEKINHQFAGYFSVGIAHIINFLQNETTTVKVFGKSIQKILIAAEENNMSTILCPYYIYISFAHYLLNEYGEAELQLKNAQKHLNGVFGSTAYPEFFFLQALIASHNGHKEQLDESLEKFTIWAKNCCVDNFEHKYLLIKAESLQLASGNELAAMDLYDQAIASAKEYGFIQNEALANELVAKFWLGRNKAEIAQLYLKKANYCYQQWGATAKVKQLQDLLPTKNNTDFSTVTQKTIASTIASTATQFTASMMFDLDSVTKAAQTLAGEIVLSKLLEKMMHIVIENAGAERGLLILEKEKGNSEWVIEAEGTFGVSDVTILQSIPLIGHLPISVVNYVVRTREPVVLANAMREDIYTEDSHIRQHQIKSVLCSPILHQGQLIGVLYLENNLIAGTFTQDRLKTLEILSSQVAISLENSLLYRTLEAKVEQRTEQLATASKKITKAHQEITLLNELLEEENMRMSTELDVAKQLQQMVLPKESELQQIDNLDIAGFMEPAEEVGGDYYEVLNHDGHIKIGIGDVTGHGLESGVLMLMVQTTVRALMLAGINNPEQFLNIINRTVYHNVKRMEIDKNLTLALLDYQNGTLQLTGQHEEVLLVRKGGKVELIDTFDLGFMIGVVDDISEFTAHQEVTLQPGDGIVLYTDGITEAQNTEYEQYGLARLCKIVSYNWSRTAKQIQQAVISDVKDYIGTQKILDDITLLVLKQR